MDQNYNELMDEFFNHNSESSIEEPSTLPQPPEVTLIEETEDNIEQRGTRFMGAPWYETIKHNQILIAGIGGIGSHTAFLLSRMNPKWMYLIDPDSVEFVNLSGQLFCKSNIGSRKIYAITDTIKDMSDYYQYSTNSRLVTHDYTIPSGYNIIISGFDNMTARRDLWVAWKRKLANTDKQEAKKLLYIDGRLLMEEFQILCVRGDDEYSIKEYEDHYLFAEEAAETPLCSMKQTTHIASMIASMICTLVTNHLTNIEAGIPIRDLPFYTEYNAELFKLITR